ncbi:MAG: retropepsin-like aspartic protease [Acidobacteriaceae bacterium]
MAIVDSGANFCVFSGDVAEELGIVIESGIPAETVGIGGTEVVWFHEITMHLPGGSVAVQAGFQRGLPVAGLLGMNGFFEHFRITFNGASRQCEFERLYES